MSEHRRRGSLGTRVFVGTALLLLAALGSAVAVATVLGNRIALRAARERIAASSSLQASSQLQRFQQLGLLAEIMAGKPEFKAYLLEAIPNHDRLSILDQLDERRSELGYDLAVVVDSDGIVAARTDQPDVAGTDLSAQPLIRQVRTQFEASGIWADRGRLYEAVAVPMALDRGVFGFLVLGYAITDVRALEVKRGTGSETLFVAGGDGKAVASSMTPEETRRVLEALRAQGDPVRRLVASGEEAAQAELRLGEERWLARLWPLRDAAHGAVGVTIALASLDRELEGYASVRNTLIGVGGASLVAALLISFLLARRVTRPIGELVRAVGAATEGRYDVDLPRGGSGEVVDLASRFNALLAELRERREMAEYVEKLSRTFGEPEAGAAAGPADVKPQKLSAAFLALELRRYLRLREAQDPRAMLERFSKDLRRADAVVRASGGRIHSVCGHRVIAAFPGPAPVRSERAVAAAAELVAQLGMPENAFDDAEPPAVAIASGELVAGTVRWGEAGASALVGLALQLAETLLREAGPGDILLAQATRDELEAGLQRAQVEVRAQRGLLATQQLYLISGVEAARVAATSDLAATHVAGFESEDVSPRLSLAGVGPGALLGGRFEILSVLGAGGMGIVYKARDRELDDLVALKMLRREVAGDRMLVERLKTELKLARKITHANVLRTFDFGEVDGFAFISMEYVRGITLRAMIERSGRLPYSAALRLARQLLSGLASAHALDILHRDIKPENVLLDAGGDLKLMDFGLARPVERLQPGQTREGWLVGTPNYVSPEQLEGREASKRSDIYACGVVLFELFTGQLPFTGGTPIEIMTLHLRAEPPAPSLIWPEIPRELEGLILRCLAKDPAQRPADAAELLARVERLSD